MNERKEKLTHLQELVLRKTERRTPVHFDKKQNRVVFGGGLMDSCSKVSIGG